MTADYDNVFKQRWYAVVNDLIGGYVVSNVDKPCSAIDSRKGSGEWQIADFMDEKTARYVADLHNFLLDVSADQ